MSESRKANPPQSPASDVAEIAHELRAPIGGIEAMAQLLLKGDLTEQQVRIVEGLRASAAHLRAVASDIIDGPAAPGPFAENDLDFESFLKTFTASAEARAVAAGLSFCFLRDGGVSQRFRADGRRIRQMLENLVDNAIKVTKAGGIAIAVEHVDRRGAFEGIRFLVSDTGPGFTAGEAATLFKPFSRLDNGTSGAGIGLAMVRRLAESMGGEAGCRSTPGEGSTFWFTLRLKALGASETEDARVTISSPQPSALPGGRVLVVDDNQANRMIMAAMLEHFGFEMAEAVNAEQALALIPGGSFAAVMLDQTLPGMSGTDALRLIRAMPEPVRSLPVIAVTGRVSRDDRAAFAAAGADGFVEKPISARAVREALEQALGGRESSLRGGHGA